jgi:hypothetical protein
MPSFSKLYKKNKGKLFPFGLYIYLKLKNKVKMSFSIWLVYILIIKIKPSQQSFSANTTIPSKGVKTVSVHLNLQTTQQFIIYGNISIQKLIAEENFQDRALTKCSILVLSNIFWLIGYKKNPFIKWMDFSYYSTL